MDGDGVGVAVICTGINWRHKDAKRFHLDFERRVKEVWNFPLGAGTPQRLQVPIKDVYGVGTMSSALISDSSFGIAPKADLYCYIVGNNAGFVEHRLLIEVLDRVSNSTAALCPCNGGPFQLQ